MPKFTQEQLVARKDYRRVVGTYGCSRLDRVVRVRPPRGYLRSKPSPRAWFSFDCPCGERHYRQPIWRWATPYERDKAETTAVEQVSEDSVV